jgi:outer membrane lipoprotein-sorting protein
MKTLIALVITLFFIAFSTLASNREAIERMNPPKHKNLFVFKADKKFLGARVEILTATGGVITAQNLEKRKMIIDFGSAQFGTYTIRVSKGNDTQEFHFIKK